MLVRGCYIRPPLVSDRIRQQHLVYQVVIFFLSGLVVVVQVRVSYPQEPSKDCSELERLTWTGHAALKTSDIMTARMAHNQDKQESIVKAILISIECRWHLRTKRLVCPIISSSRYAWFPPQSNAREWQRKSEFQLKSISSQIANIAKGLGFSLKARASNNISKNALARFWLWYPNKSQTQN